ncbi:hypothetical protein SLEP1_g23771 [Rubroshorea leprosula]|uniref:Uncharacterized protein n=1 Tax=Rubroshorea leprosula TaxID=152421 RepID=A0AAV5JMQ6_9ROSI|nr:hypothetical protein SLEP1_g23771 [Rubroshorea leprosula]
MLLTAMIPSIVFNRVFAWVFIHGLAALMIHSFFSNIMLFFCRRTLSFSL